MSFNRPFGIGTFQTKNDDAEEVGRNKEEKQKRWNSLIAGLEEEINDEPQERDLEQKNDPKDQSHEEDSLRATTRRVNDTLEVGGKHLPANQYAVNSLYMQQLLGNKNCNAPSGATTAPAPPRPPSPLPLTLPLKEWIAHRKKNSSRASANPLCYYTCGIDKKYLEDAAVVALSIAKQLQHHLSVELCVANVIVPNSELGVVELVNIGTPSDNSNRTMPEQRKAIYALGKIYYELFTQGLCPPAISNHESTEQESIFDSVLNITGGDSAGDSENRRKQQRGADRDGGPGHYKALEIAGVPPSLCRLVAHMLENDHAAGGVFCADHSVATLSDVVSDLQQMIDDPDSWLHDMLLMRLEPITPDKLYGRTDELDQFLKVASTLPRSGCISQVKTNHHQSAIMISGFSGCGKSYLVNAARKHLEERGWQCLQCKFDQEAQSQPLSTITSAFNDLLMNIFGSLDSDWQQKVRQRIHDLLKDEEVIVLCQIMPALGKLITTKTPCPPDSNFKVSFDDIQGAAASKIRLYHLFGLLVKGLSEPKRPLLISFDDLQWADTASFELMNSLLEGIVSDDDLPVFAKSEGSCVLFVGCYRSNEDIHKDTGALSACIQKMNDSDTIALTEIRLDGLSSDDVNILVSEALVYPRRLTRSLADLIHQKSAGNPFFVREFLNNLATENMLKYSLSRHKWDWDENVIEMKTLSNGVADLLTSRLQILPDGVLSVLQVMCCFSGNVSLEIFLHVGDVCDSSDVTAALECARKELLVKKSDRGEQSFYTFAHDIVQNTVFESIEVGGRIRLLKEIADTLIVKTSEERKDSILFMIVGLINQVGSRHTPSYEDRVHYAKLNLSAGEKSIQIPDFPSAFDFIKYGISFLDDNHWESEYDLSLKLFTNGVGVACSLGKSHPMTNYLNQVFDHAQRYEDKLDSMSVFIQSLIIAGKFEEALDNVVKILSYLGEPISMNLDKIAIHRELLDIQDCVERISLSSWDTMPAMEDPLKIKAMHFLDLSLAPSYFQKSLLFSVISCQIVRLTLKHGLNLYSSAGIATVAIASTSILKNHTKSYGMAKAALAIATSPKMRRDNVAAVTNAVLVLKEPIQALLPTILENYKVALKHGEMYTACINSLGYSVQGLLSGTPLTQLHKEVNIFFRNMSRYNLIRDYLTIIPVSNAITNLSGEPQHPFWDAAIGYECNEKNLSESFAKNDIFLCETIVTLEIAEHFIFRRIDMAAEFVRQYQKFFDQDCGMHPKFICIYRMFYSGLVAFNYFRETKDQYWMNLGTVAIKEMEAWAKECKWNFENKLLLLNAEYHFSIGLFDKATEEYHLSISSAHAHRFFHEEAIGNELAGYFQSERGRKDASISLTKQAKECYLSWGAFRKAEALNA